MPEEFDDFDDDDPEDEVWTCPECGATEDEICDPTCSSWDEDE